MTEELGLDERFLKLLFFDVSQIGKNEICDVMLQFFNLNKLTIDHTCSFPTSLLFTIGYCLFIYQVLTTLTEIIVRRWFKIESLVLDFMLVFEETVAILLVVVGSCYELPIDLVLLSGSMYLFNSSLRLSLENLA